MVTVVGFDTSLRKRVTCTHCTAVNEYVPNERRSKSYTDLGGCRETFYVISCGSCGKELEVR